MSKRTQKDIANLIAYATLRAQVMGCPEPSETRYGQEAFDALLEESAYDLLVANRNEGPLSKAFDDAERLLKEGKRPLNGQSS